MEVEPVPSASALEVAYLRAVHQVVDRPLVFEDPLALRIIGPDLARRIREQPEQAARGGGPRAAIVARSRADEDQLAAAAGRRVWQRIVFGAGLDTRGYRATPDEDLTTWEVDLPGTQAWKRRLLEEAELDGTGRVIQVPLDLRTDAIAAGLSADGFDLTKPAHVSMLGILVFLQPATVAKLFGFVASLAYGSSLTFDYGAIGTDLTPQQRQAREAAARVSASRGEPFGSFLDPADVRRQLRRLGFYDIVDRDWQAMNDEFFAGRSDGLAVDAGGRRLLTCRR